MMDGSHITNTTYQESSAAAIMNYAEKETGVKLKNSAGQTMSEAEKRRFEAKSEYHQFERHYVLSYEDNGMTNREVAEATRDSLNEYFGDGTDCCYAVHRKDDGTVHAHGIITGPKERVSMYPDDLREFNDQSKRIFEEKSRQRSHPARERDTERDRQTAREKRIERRDREQQRQHQRTRMEQ